MQCHIGLVRQTIWIFAIASLAFLVIACGDERGNEDSRRPKYAPYFDAAQQVESRTQTLDQYSKEQMVQFREAVSSVRPVMDKYEDLFWRQPNAHGLSIWFLYNDDGRFGDEVGILVLVTEKVPDKDIPGADRIPATLDGIKIQILQASMGRYYGAARPTSIPNDDPKNGVLTSD